MAELLAETDVLVDGPYRRELPETRRRWIGSANQRVHFLSDRCRPDEMGSTVPPASGGAVPGVMSGSIGSAAAIAIVLVPSAHE